MTRLAIRTLTQARQRTLGASALVIYIAALVIYGYVVLREHLQIASPKGMTLLLFIAQPCGFFALAAIWLVGWRIDPGLVKKFGDRGPDASECKVCKELRPPNSHHCRVCDSCVVDFDHHCAVLGICIARGNRRWFIALLAAGATASLHVLWATAVCGEWEHRQLRQQQQMPVYWLEQQRQQKQQPAHETHISAATLLALKYLPALALLIVASWLLFWMCLRQVCAHALSSPSLLLLSSPQL